MDTVRIHKLLPLVNSRPDPQQGRQGWVIASCPFAPWRHSDGVDRHPSFGIKIDKKKKSRYHCFSCGSHGDLDDLVIDLKYELKHKPVEGYNLGAALQLIANETEAVDLDIPDWDEVDSHDVASETVVFPEWWLESFKPVTMFKEAIEYLKYRHIVDEAIKALDLRYDVTRRRVCFPIRDWDGNLVGLQGRAIDKDNPLRYLAYKYKDHWNKLPWLGEHWIDPDRTVVLVESVFDLAKVYPVYQNVMCGLMAGLGKKKVERLKDIPDIVTLFDYGKGGDAARNAVSKYLKKSVIKHLVPLEIENDPGEMSYSRIQELLQPYIF